jgi:hypothetical protein
MPQRRRRGTAAFARQTGVDFAEARILENLVLACCWLRLDEVKVPRFAKNMFRRFFERISPFAVVAVPGTLAVTGNPNKKG